MIKKQKSNEKEKKFKNKINIGEISNKRKEILKKLLKEYEDIFDTIKKS
jgi:hypothetical protein